jgi:hypothetical protein
VLTILTQSHLINQETNTTKSLIILSLDICFPKVLIMTSEILDVALPEEEVTDVTKKTETIPPEGGFAGWLSVIGCSCGLFSTFGFLNA